MQKLIQFIVSEVSSKELGSKFVIYGNYEIERDYENYKYPEFDDLIAQKEQDGSFTEYHPKGTNWYGTKFTVEDMILDVLACDSRGGDTYNIIYIEKGLTDLLEEYKSNIIQITETMTLPKHILGIDDVYELMHVTDKYIYYAHDEAILMLSIEDHSIISDNYFAEVGWYDSMQAVVAGNEKLLYGEIPEDFKDNS